MGAAWLTGDVAETAPIGEGSVLPAGEFGTPQRVALSRECLHPPPFVAGDKMAGRRRLLAELKAKMAEQGSGMLLPLPDGGVVRLPAMPLVDF